MKLCLPWTSGDMLWIGSSDVLAKWIYLIVCGFVYLFWKNTDFLDTLLQVSLHLCFLWNQWLTRHWSTYGVSHNCLRNRSGHNCSQRRPHNKDIRLTRDCLHWHKKSAWRIPPRLWFYAIVYSLSFSNSQRSENYFLVLFKSSRSSPGLWKGCWTKKALRMFELWKLSFLYELENYPSDMYTIACQNFDLLVLKG